MRVQIVAVANGPERLACDAEIHFEEGDGPLAGMKLVGFSLWRSTDGAVYVTFPSRSFGVSTERKYFDYLRASNPDGGGIVVKRVKDWVLEAYKELKA